MNTRGFFQTVLGTRGLVLYGNQLSIVHFCSKLGIRAMEEPGMGSWYLSWGNKMLMENWGSQVGMRVGLQMLA